MSLKKPRFIKPITLLAVLVTLDANAQFNKYRSRSRFSNPDGEASTAQPTQIGPQKPMDLATQDEADMMTPEDAATIEAANSGDNDEVDPVAIGDDDEPANEDEANISTFGSRVRTGTVSKDAKAKAKYVNLNPETAFGPEIVESFDFPDTDIMELTKHMQKLTGINLILDKDVKGKVSIIAPTAITVGDAWKAYLTALNMAGYTLVKSGAFYKVINARDIRYTPTKIYTGNYTPDTENYVMRVIALKSVSAAEIARNFRPFMSRYGRIIDIKQTNTVIMADTGTNINRLVKMVKFLDVPGHEETLQIVRVKNSSAQEIAKLLDSILKGGGNAAAGRPGATASPRFAGAGGESTSTAVISRIIAEPRTNSIIAMANAEGAKQLRDLIGKLDVKLVSSGSGRVHVYYLNYGDSEELAKTLSSIVTGNIQQAGAGGAAPPRFSSSGGVADNAIFSAEVKITADKNNNALVVTASPTDWLTLKDVVSRLDIPRDQVYVEGMILEANVSKDKAFGTTFVGAYGTGNAQRAGLGGSDLWNLLGGNPTSIGGFFTGVGVGGTRSVTLPGSTTPVQLNSVNALIKAVASHQNSNVLATPQILALDNTEATFEVGETVPIKNSTVGTGGQTSFNTTTQEAKLSLKITPQINKVTRFVKLKINQRIDDFKAVDPSISTAGNGVPTTVRSAVTEVMVRDRDTIAMGGLLRDRETVTFSKVPLLGDIPVLGWLFKSKARRLDKINLLFFMTPRILAPYTKTASKHTLDVMKQRETGMKGIFEGDDKDPADKQMKDLKAKVENQMAAPLYDEEDAAHYRNLNENTNSLETAPEIEDDMDLPNYQDIKKSIE
ncbi:MAG: type II secretion system secretin GspD [Bacteriovoracaceae bacterium]|nr:type II secretion system secretin GspD [Bacteriovoracaceae bacterium]